MCADDDFERERFCARVLGGSLLCDFPFVARAPSKELEPPGREHRAPHTTREHARPHADRASPSTPSSCEMVSTESSSICVPGGTLYRLSGSAVRRSMCTTRPST